MESHERTNHLLISHQPDWSVKQAPLALGIRRHNQAAGHSMASNLIYSVDFFAMQLRFASKVSEISGLPLAETLGTHTNIYVRLGMGPKFNPTNPDWLEYVSALSAARDPAGWTHEVHRRRSHLPTGPEIAVSVGCFSYALIGQHSVRLHFHAGPSLSDSPLSLANEKLRRWELATLLSKAAASDENTQVIGASWLYNLMAYRRIFPEPYICSLRPIEHTYERLPLWGQFLNRDGAVRSGAVQQFDSRLADAVSLSDLNSCFPYQVLSTSVPIKCLLALGNTQRDAAR